MIYYNERIIIHSSMKTLQFTTPKTASSTNFSAVTAEAKNSSLSFGGGYSQSSGWNANVTFTKKW
jgi:hypothetical protein